MNAEASESGAGSGISRVLFDLDNTLLDRAAGFERLCRELFRTGGAMERTHSEDAAVALMIEWDQSGIPLIPTLLERITDTWPDLFRDLDQAVAVFLEMLPRMVFLDPRTRNMLEDFSDQGIACGIVTNGGTLMQRAKIEESGLQELVASFTISQDVGVAKPDPAIFAHALKTIGARAGTTLFVGDNPEHDVAGAKAVGMRTAWLGLGRQWPLANVTPDYTLDHVWQVRDLVLGDQR